MMCSLLMHPQLRQRETELHQARSEESNVRSLYDSSTAEVQRLESRIQSTLETAQREQDVLAAQLARREEVVAKQQAKVLQLREVLALQEKKV